MNDDVINESLYRRSFREDSDEQEERRDSPLESAAKNRAKKLATNQAKRVVTKGAQKLTQTLIKQGLMTAGRAAVTAVTSSGPWGWIIAGIIIAVILIFIIFFGGSGSGSNETAVEPTPPVGGNPSFPPIPGFSLTLDGDEDVENGQIIEYTISYSYNPSVATAPIESITIYNDIPPNASFVGASGNTNVSGNTVSWTLNEDSPNAGTVTITLRPAREDILVINKVYARTTFIAESGENVPPTDDNCQGRYGLNNPLRNFGDPNCDFTKDQLYNMLQGLDPTYADLWYYKIIPCESSYNPNAYASHFAIGTPDAAGAWGLVQMGRGKNGQYDHGDVVWTLQISNAINDYYKRQVPAGITNHGAYWACGR